MSATRPSLRARLGPNATRVAVVTALVLFALLALVFISSTSAGTYEVRAVFEDVRGLIPGGEVKAGAVTVGAVDTVELNAEDEPEVTMDVEEDFQLHEGAVANIRLGSNVGAVNRTVDLTQGDVSRPELPRGTVLRGASTDQPVNFDTAVETLDPPTRADIKRFLLGLEAALRGRGGDFDRTLKYSSTALNETAGLLAAVSEDGEALRTLVSEGDRVLSALASNPQALGEGAENMARLLATTANHEADLAESTEELAPALAAGRRTLDRLASATPELRRLVSGARPVVDELKPFAHELPDATKAAGPFLAETRTLVRGGPGDLRRIGPIIEEAAPIATDFPPVIEKAIPLAKDLAAYVPETLGFFQNFGAAGSTFDKVGHILTLAVSPIQVPPASTTSREIGPEECAPGMLEKPFIRLPGTNECEPWPNFAKSFEDLVPKELR